jgi:hypothetical protein
MKKIFVRKHNLCVFCFVFNGEAACLAKTFDLFIFFFFLRMRVFLILVTLVLFALASTGATSKKSRQPLNINVHLVSHTHDDTGWLKTVDQYHYGANNTIQFAGTQYILDSVVQALLKDPERRFTYVEMAFFHRWWMEQDNNTKADVKMLVNESRLQFVNGGWCMHDEANPHYIDMIDQMTLGHRFLLRDLNAVPKVGWQIDPFGHSNTNAFLTSQRAGFISTFFGRADFYDYLDRAASKRREFTWYPSASNPTDGLLGGILLTNHYGPPEYFHWDVTNPRKDPMKDDPRLNDYNVDEMVEKFVTMAVANANITLGINQMWTMGDDFNYQDANFWFKNLDKLIKAVREDGRVNVQHSTPYDYSVAKLQEQLTFPIQTDDFFPYEDCPHCYWTGYFTSRPALKRYIRDVSAYYNVARQIQALFGRKSEAVSWLADAMGLAQHHDAVAGTAKQHVAFDYAQRLAKGVNDDLVATTGSLAALAGVSGSGNLSYCRLLNVTICDVTAALTNTSLPMTVVVWNGMGQVRNSETVFVPVPSQSFKASVPFSIFASPSFWSDNYNYRGDVQPFVLAATVDVPPVGYMSFVISPTSSISDESVDKRGKNAIQGSPVALSNRYLSVAFGAADGWISSISNKVSGTTVNVSHGWCYYESNEGDIFSGQASGAYIFRPKSFSYCVPIAAEGKPVLVVSTPVIQVVERQVADWLWERLTLTADDRNIRHEFTVGHVPISDNVGKEVVYQVNTSIASSKIFYTDSNGREMQKRTRDARTFPWIPSEPVAQNYYPVNALVFLNDTAAQFSIHVDSSVGGGSIFDGSLEVMVHRRILHDDGRGVGEPHNETEYITPYYGDGVPYGQHYGPGLIIRGTHRWTLEATPSAMAINRPIMDRVYYRPQLYFTEQGATLQAASLFGIATPLPANLQIITLNLLDDGYLLLRLAHQYAVSEDPILSAPATVSIAAIIPTVAAVMETTMTTSQQLGPVQGPVFDVTVNPMDVRTFLLTLK